jgi:hypothetical protein
MMLHLFFYQLALITLVWLFFLLLYAWPRDRARRPHPAAPIAPRRQRSNAPKPFAGLTQKPHCALCEQDIPHPQALPAVRPDPLPPTHRRPRTVDTSQHFCPRVVAIAAGSGLAIFAPTVIPVAAPGVSSSAPHARGISRSTTARSATANRRPSSSSCGLWRAWPRA